MLTYSQSYVADSGEPLTAKIHGNTPVDLERNLLKFRIRMGVHRATPEEVAEDVAAYAGEYRNPKALKAKASNTGKIGRLSFSDVLRGTRALMDIVKGDIATQQEIERRAKICEDCPKLAATSDCKTCGGGRKFSRYANTLALAYGKGFVQPKIKSGKASEFYCGECGCSILNLILSKSKHFLSKETKERPKNCWASKSSPNWRD